MASAAVHDAIWSHDFSLLRHLHGILDFASFPGNLIDVAASINDLAILEYLNQVGHGGCTTLAMHWACHHGNVTMVEFLHQRRHISLDSRSLESALIQGHMDIVAYFEQHVLRERIVFPQTFPFKQVTGNGHLDAVKYIHSHDGVFPATAIDAAATNGHLDIVQWLRTNTDATCSYIALLGAARNGHMAIVHFLIEHFRDKFGRPDLGNPFKKVEFAIHVASENGHLEIVKYLVAHHIDDGVGGTIDQAAAYGHLHIIQWLVENGVDECKPRAADLAACNGHLHVVEWLHARGVGIDNAWWLATAASNGHFEMIKWLCQHASAVVYPHGDKNRISGETVYDTVRSGHFEIVRWLVDRHPTINFPRDVMAAAATIGRLDMLQWLHTRPFLNSCTNTAFGEAAANGHLDVLKWLHANTAESCADDILESALGHRQVLQWLVANRSEGCRRRARQMAEMSEQFAAARFLQSLPRGPQECATCQEVTDDEYYDTTHGPCLCLTVYRPWLTDYISCLTNVPD
ncbi:Aste57867_16264 [Aphanomyces stellatus]|uniref:Aste57867_16264 protein n=1 Tax=Aphanomyces stellatus TaxID=120398 RepID=A0A485L5A6_9STRA|nr:hypothetical protein As57867_016207 [Aphanomyces stellatus]VFT93041.1 Aste57867_16264 [Aphanomyces stellatus]